MTLLDDDISAIEELSKLDQNLLIDRLNDISVSAWDKCIETNSIRSWLTNFTGECLSDKNAEQNLALWLAVNFVFYTDKDVRSLVKNAWWKYIHLIIKSYHASGFMMDKSTNEIYNYIRTNTIIQPLGNCAGSGTNVAYFFRQENALDKKMFEIPIDNNFKYLLLVDDATLSGHQAEENAERYSHITDKEIYILTLISTGRAREYLKNKLTLLSALELDDKSKCFSHNSHCFHEHPNWTRVAKIMCTYYGKNLFPRNPRGYRNGQYLFGFYYNTPNNTLPIFWGTFNNWRPLFLRYFSDDRILGDLKYEKFY